MELIIQTTYESNNTNYLLIVNLIATTQFPVPIGNNRNALTISLEIEIRMHVSE